MAFFSVIIPLYNKEKFVENAINSILKQTFSDFEIIIVEDCSTDNSLDVVTKINSNKITLLKHDINKGLSASRNTGIKNATANFLAFLDADDVWKPNYLEKIQSLILKFPQAKLYATNYEELYPNNLILLPKNSSNRFDDDTVISNFFQISLAQSLYFPSSLCVEKSVFKKIDWYNEKITFGEDVDFNIRANNIYKLAYSKEALVTYTMFSENQITNTSLKNKTIPDFDSYESLCDENLDLKKYLDFNRYIFARQYKMENDTLNFLKMKEGIKSSNLNFKQQILLHSPLFILKLLKQIKHYFIKKKIRIVTFDSN